LTCNFDDLELGLFKVIQGQMLWCQSIAHGLFHIRLPFSPLIPSWYLVTALGIFDIKAMFPKEQC